MHYDISYQNKATTETRAKALSDIIDWLGEAKYQELNAVWRAEAAALGSPVPYQRFAFLCAFAGLQGYPVTVWHDALWPDGSEASVESALGPTIP